MGKFRMLWFLLWHARCCDSLSWKMLVMMEGFAVYGGVKPDKARSLVMGLTDESPYLEQVTVGHVVESVVEEQLGPKHPLLLSFLQGRLSKMQSGFDNQGNDSGEEACDG